MSMTLEQAARATYFVLEAASGKTPRPALLGVLSPDRTFTQWIVDPAMASVRTASDGTRTDSLERALGHVVDESLVGDTRIFGYRGYALSGIDTARPSAFIRDPLTPACERAKDVLMQWTGGRYHTSAGAPRVHRRQLRRLFADAGYRHDWQPDHAGPAARIRRLRRALRTDGDQSPRVGPGARRDLETLLLENRYDCLGLRHLMLRATAEVEKRAAYMDSIYAVRDGAREISFRIGVKKPALDALVRKRNERQWAHVSACDPGLQTFTADENERRSRALTAIARQRGYVVLEGTGQDRARRRPPEDTQLIVGIGSSEARALAREFGQWAIVAGRVGGTPALIWCLDPGPDPLVVNQLATLPEAAPATAGDAAGAVDRPPVRRRAARAAVADAPAPTVSVARD